MIRTSQTRLPISLGPDYCIRMTWEQRWHPLREEWVVVSAHRMARPWSGEVHEEDAPPPAYDPECHFCPGNVRIGGERNPDYEGIHTFDNDSGFQGLHQKLSHEILRR